MLWLPRLLGVTLTLTTACGVTGDPPLELPNSHGKEDGVSVRRQLTDADPTVDMRVPCESASGCDGWFAIQVVSPDACELLANPRCGRDYTGPLERAIYSLEVRSDGEATEKHDVRITSPDGIFIFFKTAVVRFSSNQNGYVDATIEKLPDVPDLELALSAEWTAK